MLRAMIIIATMFVSQGCEFASSGPDYSVLENASVLDGGMDVSLKDLKFKTTSKTSEKVFSSDKVNLVFFGFPGCHGVCPTTVAAVTDELSALPKTKKSQYKFIFVNVDPNASNSQVGEFLNGFDADYLGVLPDSEEDLAKMTKQFGAFSRKASPEEKTLDAFIHSPQVFIVSGEGKWVGYYNFPILKGKIAGDLSKLKI